MADNTQIVNLQELVDKLRADLNVNQGEDSLYFHEKKWKTFVINPFNYAYKKAFNNYKGVLANDAQLERERMELAFSALTLFGGSLLTTVLGKMTWKEKIGDMAIDYICNNNMNTAFNIAQLTVSNPIANFIVGKAWDGGTSWLQASTKQVFTTASIKDNYPTITSPDDMNFATGQFFDMSVLKLSQALNDLFFANVSPSIKASKLKLILASPFCKPPKQLVYSNVDDLVDKIELGFYMRLLLASDFNLTRVSSNSGNVVLPKIGNPITTSPSKSNYPSKNDTYYALIGDSATKKMNKLYKKIMTTNSDILTDGYLGQYTNQKVLKDAEQVLLKLGNETNGKILTQISAAP